MRDPDAHPTQPPVDLLTAVRERLWRHSSQPNGDPWDGDPEHLDRAAQRLLSDLARWLDGSDTQPAISCTSAESGRPVPMVTSPRVIQPRSRRIGTL
jgi:hypothetical protein